MEATRLSEPQRRGALVAGAMYLYTIVGSLLYMSWLRPMLVVPGDLEATARNITVHPLLFRAGTTHEILMALAIIPLAWGLYVLLRSTHARLALLALCWRTAESILWALTGLVTLAAAQVVGADRASAFGVDQQVALLGVLLGANESALNVVILLTGLGSIIFFSLFLRSRLIARPLAIWGLVTYAVIIPFSCVKLVVPTLAALDMLIYTPGALFEIVIGGWLLYVASTSSPSSANARAGRRAW
ncbi:MAG: DUF4386 domain-containing protein [Myxococcales bacterium]|nr:DUF4386 domain-containing protein [Myxococcales bacterium]